MTAPADLEASIQDRWAEVYDEVYFHRPPVRGLLINFRDYVYRQIQKGQGTRSLANVRLMDTGCGTGELLHLFQKDGIRVLAGVDVSSKMIAAASRKCPGVSFFNGTFETVPGTSGSYDVIVGTEWLHHLQNLRPVFQRAYDLLTPGGIFCAMEPNHNWLFDQVGVRQSLYTLFFGPLLRLWTLKNRRRIEHIRQLEGDRGYNPWHRHITVREIQQAIDPAHFDLHVEVRHTLVPYFSSVLFDNAIDRALYGALQTLDRLWVDRMGRGEYIFVTAVRK